MSVKKTITVEPTKRKRKPPRRRLKKTRKQQRASLEKQEKVLIEKLEKERKEVEAEMALKAKYVIQIWFKSDRSNHKDIAFSLSFWESGKRLHGGGDEMMFICQRNPNLPKVKKGDIQPGEWEAKPTERGCGNLIPGQWGDLALIRCPSCGTRHPIEWVGDSVFYRRSHKDAANILEKWWVKLGCNADIYAKYSPTDPRTLLMAKIEDIHKARSKKGLTRYLLKDILDDVSNGASVHKAFLGFIRA